jgi:hypothetical protein
MVQVIENHAAIRGRVTAVGGDAPPRFVRVHLDVESVADVESYPNFFTGETALDVLVPADVCDALQLTPNTSVALVAQRTPRGNFAHPEKVIVLHRP